MFWITIRLEIEPSPLSHPNPIKILPFGNKSEIIVGKNELVSVTFIHDINPILFM